MTISACYQMERGEFRLDVNMTLAARGVTAVFGPSGCGKTTLLRCIAGLERPRVGSFRFEDSVWQDEQTFLPCHKRPIGYVFQEASLFPHLSVRKNLEFGLKRIPAEERRIRLDEAAEMLGVVPLLDRDPAGLSGGERQRTAIARALLTSPKLLMMDEPLAGLDQESKVEILKYLKKVFAEWAMPVLYVSHLRDEVERLAAELVFMEAGRVVSVEALSSEFGKPHSNQRAG